MADDKSNLGGRDRARVAGEEGYEVRYFAHKHAISVDQAQRLIKENGNHRAKLDSTAAKMTK